MSAPVVDRPRGVIRTCARLARRDPAAYGIALVMWGVEYLLPFVVGLIMRALFNRVQDGGPVIGLLALLAGFEIGRSIWLLLAIVQWHGAWVGWTTTQRANLLRSLAVDSGAPAGRLPGSAGEAVSRFRDDAEDIALVLDTWLDFFGTILFSVAATVTMALIDLRATVVILSPLALVAIGNRLFADQFRTWHSNARTATAAVTGFIGDTFGSITAVKAAGAESAALARLDSLGLRRADASRRAAVGNAAFVSLAGTAGNIGLGAALIVLAPSLASGSHGIGDLALFSTYTTSLAALPRWVGRLVSRHRHAEISLDRMALLTTERTTDAVVAATPIHLRHAPPEAPPPVARLEPLRELRVEGLTVRSSADDGGGVRDVSFRVPAGTLTVLTGPVGCGKSTVVRALLGLIELDAGTVWWNGAALTDLSVAMAPPSVAYVPQLPRLFSETLEDTVLLGWDDQHLADALSVAQLGPDLERLPAGLLTKVGPRGVRLSGGQVQRVAAARAFVRRADLLVVDDLSSALDPPTEEALWSELLAGEQRTLLCVTNRPAVIARADQVLTLAGGRLI